MFKKKIYELFGGYATSQKVPGSRPNEVDEFFQFT
jgi:hypothetical protein